MRRSDVQISGTISRVDLSARDIVVDCGGVPIKVHMWTTTMDSHGVWRSEDEWRNYCTEGAYVTINGYLGNNNRVIAPPGSVVINTVPENRNILSAIGYKTGRNQLCVATPGGKNVFVECNSENFLNLPLETEIALIGEKLECGIKVSFIERVRGTLEDAAEM